MQDDTGAWLALDANFLVGQQFTMSWLYDAQLRAELTRRLGIRWEQLELGHGQADIAGIPTGLLTSSHSGRRRSPGSSGS